jgi:hypothetical protein
MGLMRRWSSVGHQAAKVIVILCGIAHRANANPQDEAAEAQALFRQGREAVQAGDCASAIPFFRKSHTVYPARGTLFNLAQCEAKVGQVVSAWKHFKELLAQLPPEDERVPATRRHIVELDRRMPKLIVEAEPSTRLLASVVLDRTVLPLDNLSVERLIEPGSHTLVARWTSGEAKRIVVNLAEGARVVVRLVSPGTQPASASASAQRSVLATPEATNNTRETSPLASSGALDSRRGLALIVCGVGLGAIGAGTVTGLMAISKKNELKETCPISSQCTQEGLDLAAQGEVLTTTSTVAFVVGLASVGASAALLLTMPRRPASAAVAVAVLPGGGGGVLRGRF